MQPTSQVTHAENPRGLSQPALAEQAEVSARRIACSENDFRAGEATERSLRELAG